MSSQRCKPEVVNVDDFHPAFCVSMQHVLVVVRGRRGRVCTFLSDVCDKTCYVTASVYEWRAWHKTFTACVCEAARVCGVRFVWRVAPGVTNV